LADGSDVVASMTNFLQGSDILLIGLFDISSLLLSKVEAAFKVDEFVLLPNIKDDPDPTPADSDGAVVKEDTVVLATNGLIFAYAPKPKDPTPAASTGRLDIELEVGWDLSTVLEKRPPPEAVAAANGLIFAYAPNPKDVITGAVPEELVDGKAPDETSDPTTASAEKLPSLSVSISAFVSWCSAALFILVSSTLLK
jgi:hypothetical protein